MLAELSVGEQRYLAVREALDTGRYTHRRRQQLRGRPQDRSWLARSVRRRGLGGLSDRSSKPDRCPHQIRLEVEPRIVALRRTNPGWGHRTILSKLGASSSCLIPLRHLPLPGTASLHRPQAP
jgi:hypothetical protein